MTKIALHLTHTTRLGPQEACMNDWNESTNSISSHVTLTTLLRQAWNIRLLAAPSATALRTLASSINIRGAFHNFPFSSHSRHLSSGAHLNLSLSCWPLLRASCVVMTYWLHPNFYQRNVEGWLLLSYCNLGLIWLAKMKPESLVGTYWNASKLRRYKTVCLCSALNFVGSINIGWPPL
jgi:hypothetical protein